MRLYSNICLLSVSWPCMASLYYRHNSIASVFFLGLGIIKSCISRFLSGIKMKLFLTSLLNPLEENLTIYMLIKLKSRKENSQKLTQLSSRSHPRHLVGNRGAQKDITIDTTSDSQVNSNFPNRWSPASVTFNNYFYLFLYLYIT